MTSFCTRTFLFFFHVITSASNATPSLNSRGFSTTLNTEICPQPSRCTIPTIEYHNHLEFITKYREIQPVILRGATQNWPSVSGNHKQFTWDYLHAIAGKIQHVSVGNSLQVITAQGLDAAHAISLRDHLDDMKALRSSSNPNNNSTRMTPTRYQTQPLTNNGDTQSNEPMYVFHRGGWRNKQLYHPHDNTDAVEVWLKNTCQPTDPLGQNSSDFMEYIFGMGGPGSGTTLHRHGETWLYMIEGTKRLIMYPPSQFPPLQYFTEM